MISISSKAHVAVVPKVQLIQKGTRPFYKSYYIVLSNS